MTTWRRTFAYVGLAVVLAAVAIALAPTERTLGSGIRIVYLHVALTLAGVVLFAVATMLGLVAATSGSAGTARWVLSITEVGLGLFAAGTLTSLLAAWINWGGGILEEPLLRSSLVVLSIGFLAYATMHLVDRARLRGLLGTVPAIAVAWALLRTPVLLHPGGSVLPDSAGPVQATFLVVTALCVAAGARLVWQRAGSESSDRPEGTVDRSRC